MRAGILLDLISLLDYSSGTIKVLKYIIWKFLYPLMLYQLVDATSMLLAHMPDIANGIPDPYRGYTTCRCSEATVEYTLTDHQATL